MARPTKTAESASSESVAPHARETRDQTGTDAALAKGAPITDAPEASSATVAGASGAVHIDEAAFHAAGTPGEAVASGGEVIVSVRVLSRANAQRIGPGSVMIVCRQPGLRRAGIAHPAFAVYTSDHFTPSQQTLLSGEPLLEVIGVF